jgi:hypothetical protein
MDFPRTEATVSPRWGGEGRETPVDPLRPTASTSLDATRARGRLTHGAWSALAALNGAFAAVDLGDLTGPHSALLGHRALDARRAVVELIRTLALAGSPIAQELIRSGSLDTCAPCEKCSVMTRQPVALDDETTGLRVLLCADCWRDAPRPEDVPVTAPTGAVR